MGHYQPLTTNGSVVAISGLAAITTAWKLR